MPPSTGSLLLSGERVKRVRARACARAADSTLSGGRAFAEAKEIGIEGFERIVALKRLLPHLAEDASFVRSFVREAKLASLLRHANIVQLYELGRVGAVYFIAMEHVDGLTLFQMARRAWKCGLSLPMELVLTAICFDTSPLSMPLMTARTRLRTAGDRRNLRTQQMLRMLISGEIMVDHVHRNRIRHAH